MEKHGKANRTLMPKVGDTHRFVPAAYYAALEPDKGLAARRARMAERMVTGRIISVNEKHRHFAVAYEVNGTRQVETFKF